MARFPAIHRQLLTLLLAIAPTVQAQSTKPPPLPLDAMRTMASVFGLIRTDYVTDVEGERLVGACTKGMFSALDPSSAFLDADTVNALKGARGAESSGVGLELILRAGLPTVASTSEGSPAEMAGLRPRDYILEIDGESMEEADLRRAVDLLKGKSGTEVALTIRRPGESAPRTMKLVRQTVPLKPVAGRRVPGDLGYLRVRSLREGTAAELRAAFRALQQAGPLKGLVLDLRHSPGGLFNTSIEIAAMFLPEQAVVVRTEGRLPEANQTYTADRAEVQQAARGAREPWPEALTTLPVVVLVDGGTASGSEIIAAALRDNGRARLLGSKTLGRGSIQTVRMLPANAAIKLTTAFYRTPGGQQLQGRGLLPDETLPDLDRFEHAGTDRDPLLQRAAALLSSKGG